MKRIAALVLISALLPAATATAAGDPRRSEQWGLDMVESDAARPVASGAGALVAIVDSIGPDQAGHTDLAGQVAGGRDFTSGDTTPAQGDPHGIHVGGIVAALEGNGVGVASVAPGARLLMVRVLDDDGGGFVSDVAAGVDWARENGAHVINLSLSSEVPLAGASGSDAFTRALDRALDAGIVVVAAAGNSGLPACENPSAQGRLLCVGAVDRRGGRSFFSSFGQGLGLMAPGGSGLPGRGENVLSTYSSNGYAEVAGTSQATPHVAGVAALLASKGIRGQDAVRRILATTRDAGFPGPDPEYGAGIVNARQAVAGLAGAPGGAAPGAGSGGGSTPGQGNAARVSVPPVQRIRTVLRRGILVRCRAAGAGTCRASASRRGGRIARGSKRLRAGRAVSFRARTTRSGRRLLRGARRVRVSVLVTLPGSAPVRRTVVLKR